MTGRFTCNEEIRLLLSVLTLVKLLMLFHTKNCSLDYNRTKLAVLSYCGYSISSVDELIKLRLATESINQSEKD